MSENKIYEEEKLQIASFIRFNRPRAGSKKIRMKSITFEYGECDGKDPYPLTFTTWKEANGWIYAMSPGNVVYYKTWFTIEYENGRKYNGRYDIQGRLSDRQEIADLGASVRRNCLHGAGRVLESNCFLTKTQQEIYADLLDHYEIRAFTI